MTLADDSKRRPSGRRFVSYKLQWKLCLGFIVCDRALPLIASEALQNMGSFSVFQLDPCSFALYLRT
ncbi:MAG: hypothetical protein AOY29_03525 [Alcanivorax borkumensis]|nr:MAG: hypothetical protein AOY29_03525 [Alcanivorax borkumensis]